VFLDANFVIETIGLRRSEIESENLKDHEVYVSPLTIHVMCYSFKIKLPDKKIDDFVDQIYLTNFTEDLTKLALSGPTADFEDNIQLHSAAETECNYFLTNNEKLLKMKFFGKTEIVNDLTN